MDSVQELRVRRKISKVMLTLELAITILVAFSGGALVGMRIERGVYLAKIAGLRLEFQKVLAEKDAHFQRITEATHRYYRGILTIKNAFNTLHACIGHVDRMKN